MGATWDDRTRHSVLTPRDTCTPLTPCHGCQFTAALVRAVNRGARRLGRAIGRTRWLRTPGLHARLERFALTLCTCGPQRVPVHRILVEDQRGIRYAGPSIDCPAHGCWDRAHEGSSDDPCPRCGSRSRRA